MNYVIDDFKKSLEAWRFWTLFGYHDAYAPLLRTRFGFLFYTLQSLLYALIIYFVMGPSIAKDVSYFGYVALGVPLFRFYSSAVTGGYSILSRNGLMIQNGKIPFLACIFRFFIDQFVRFFFAIVVFIGFMIVYPTVTWATLLILPGIVIAVVFIFAVALTFMVVGAFFPDLSQMVNTIMAMMFFATPVFWHAGQHGEVRNLIAQINPLSHLISVVREPAMGQIPTMFSYAYACSVTVLLVIASMWLFAKTRNWIVFKL